MNRIIAKTANWRAYLTDKGKALEIERLGARTTIVIGVADLPEYERLIAKAKGALELRKTVPLPEELEPES